MVHDRNGKEQRHLLLPGYFIKHDKTYTHMYIVVCTDMTITHDKIQAHIMLSK
jgi:hypothetical protein